MKRSKIRKFCKGFTFLEMVMAILILVVVYQMLDTVMTSFLVSGKRLSSMSYSNQEIERFRAALNKDLRTALDFEIPTTNKSLLILTCAVDVAAVDGDSLAQNDAVSRSPIGGANGVNLMDAGSGSSIYYTVTYEYVTNQVVSMSSRGFSLTNNPYITYHPMGLMEMREGAVIRRGPMPDPVYGGVTLTRKTQWEAIPSSAQYGTMITEGWYEPTNALGEGQGIFDYWPHPGIRQTSAGVSINLWKRDSFKTTRRVYDYPQEFSTFVSSRLYR